MTPQEFVTCYEISATVTPTTTNRFMSDAPPHFIVTLTRPSDRHMEVTFSQGSAHTEEPTAAEIIECLASDASGIENTENLHDWCAEFGETYDVEMEEWRARWGFPTLQERYNATVEQTRQFKQFLGAEYEEALWHMDDD